MQYTTNYQLKQPEGNDYVSVADLSENFAVIDAKMKENADAAAAAGDKSDIEAEIEKLNERMEAAEGKLDQIQWGIGVDETGVYVIQIAETAGTDTVSAQFALDEPGMSPYTVEIEGTGEKSISNADHYQFEIL